jgi:iron complex outermembrane receptor protein
VNASFRYDLFQVNTQGTGVVNEQQYSLLLASDIAISKLLSSSLGLRTEGRDDRLSPSMPYLGLIFRLGQKMGLIKGNVSRVFRFPTMNERYWQPGGNPDLLPEEGWNYELTYKYEKVAKRLNWSFQVTAFYSQINDWILWYPSAMNVSVWQAQNLWQVDNSGLEFVSALDWNISPLWKMDLKLFYSYNATTVSKDLSNDHSLEGKQLILVPQHLVYIPFNVSYRLISVGVNYRFTGIRYTDRQNSNYLDAYQLIDLNFNYSLFQHKLDLGLSLNNILNQSYQTYPGQPMPGFNFNLQVTWKII